MTHGDKMMMLYIHYQLFLCVTHSCKRKRQCTRCMRTQHMTLDTKKQLLKLDEELARFQLPEGMNTSQLFPPICKLRKYLFDTKAKGKLFRNY